jgi:sterol desaturase/sphingolipid hydroxylase (fatty acid hydroxylase superfamily)
VASLFFLFGYVIEKWAPAGEIRSRREMLLNCACGSFFILFDIVSLLLVWFLLIHAPPVFRLFPRDRVRSIAMALVTTFAWLALRDFFYYWLHRLQHTSS